MAGKFSLLTIMTLNAAGYDKGINQATKKTQAFKKGTAEAGKSISSSFTSMGGVLGGAVNSQVGLLSQSIGAGVSAFKSMIPAITGVKTALIASGIGAIVVAIGVAFGALSSYLTSTKDGADTLNTIMTGLKTTFNVIIQRVNFLGSALIKLFKGDFKGMKEDFQSAFKGGIFEEINNGIKTGTALGKEANELKRRKIALDREELDINVEKGLLDEKARLYSEGSAKKQQALAQLRSIDEAFDKKKLKYLQDNYNLAVKTYNASTKGYDDEDKLTQAYKELQEFKIKDTQESIGLNKLEGKIYKEIQSDKAEESKGFIEVKENEIQTLKDERESLYAQGKAYEHLTGKILFLENQVTAFNDAIEKQENALKLNVEIDDLISEQLEKDMQYILNEVGKNNQLVIEPILAPVPVDYTTKLTEQLSSIQTISGLASEAISGLGNAFIELASTGEASFKDMVTSMLGGLRSVIYGLFAEALANTIVNALNPKNPANQATFGLAGIAAAAVGITAVSALWAKLPKFASGGIMGGNSFNGDNLTARINSGEMILNQSQQANLFALANSGGISGGEVRFEIAGDRLIGVLNNYGKKIKTYR